MVRLVFATAMLTLLAACGDTVGEQTLAGGVVGAAASTVTGADVPTGAVVGAAGNVVYCQQNPGQC